MALYLWLTDSSGNVVHEIAMNPAYFAVVPLIEVMQTLVHEMSHGWQREFGKPARGRYHNAEWARKMEAIGLMPSDTGAPGGAKTGDRMADYPIPGGKFLAVCERLIEAKFRISWYDRFPPEQVKAAAQNVYALSQNGNQAGLTAAASQLPEIAVGERERLSEQSDIGVGVSVKKATRVKYSCNCRKAVWGKPQLKIRCEECKQLFEAES